MSAVIAHLAPAMLPLNVCWHGTKPPCATPNVLEPQGMNVLLSLKRIYVVAAAATLTIVPLGRPKRCTHGAG